MGFLTSQIAARLLIFGITTAASVAVPYMLQDRPRLLWVWDKVGPRVVDMAKDRVNDRFAPEPSNDAPVK